MSTRFTIALVVATLATAGCGTGDGRQPTDRSATRRDSAGIEIVENGAGAPEDWRIDSAIALRIGDADAASKGAPYQFDGIRGVARLRNGHLVVADRGSTEVRVFDSTGAFLRVLLQKGGGPGELYEISDLHHTRDDSIFVENGEMSALAVFGPDLSVVRTVRPVEYRPDSVRERDSYPSVQAIFDDGSVLGGSRSTGHSSPDRRPPVTFSFVDSTFYSRGIAGPGGRQLAELGWIASDRGYAFLLADGGWLHTWLFEPHPSRAVRGTDLYVADGATVDVRVYGGDGRLRRIIRADHPRVSVRWGDHPMLALDGDKRSIMLGDRRVALATPVPELPPHHPVVDALHVDPSGNIWMRCLVATQPSRTVWLVFDSTGTLRHRVPDAGEIEIEEIGDNHVVSIARDTDGVESVVVRRIRKHEP